MYYIPGAQKNVYLKEISGLVKAIRKTGGVEPIAHAPDLNAVRNLLLDWVSAVLGDTGPEAVARMIKLEVRQAQAGALPGAPAIVEAAAGRRISRVAAFSVLVAPPDGVFVLAQDADWAAMLEKETKLAQSLARNAMLTAAGRQLFVTGSTSYSGGRILYQCVAVINGS
jgi:hypothetical protein